LIRRSLRFVKNRRARRKWSADQKRKIAEVVQQRLRDGVPFSEICRELDILRGTLQLWVEQYPLRELAPVKIDRRKERSPAITVERKISGSISLHTPPGFRFDGLDVGDVAALLEELR
jgi:transposase-like protein